MSKKLTDEQKAEKRLKVAKELATKDGRTFEHLTEMMQNAYLHNADCAIVDREAKPISATGQIVPAFTCPICKDMGFIGDTPCYDCNPVGLPKEEAKKEEPEPEKPKDKPIPKTGQYYCTKCKICHYEDKKLGKRHLKYREAPNDNRDTGGTERDNQPAGGADTRKPEQPQKPKAEKKA